MARNQYERQKQAHERLIQEKIDSYQEIVNSKEEMTEEQRDDVARAIKDINVLKKELDEVNANLKTLQEVEDIGRSIGPALGNVSIVSEPEDRLMDRLNRSPVGLTMKDLGQQFVDSTQYKGLINQYRETGGRLPQGFTTGPVGLETKGTLSGLDAGGAQQLHSVPEVVPGAVQTLFQPLSFASLLLEGQSSNNLVRYVVEGTATNAAAGVLEVGWKPDSAIGFTTTDEPIRKIATYLPVSEETLQDAPAIQSYINGRLTLFVQLTEESYLFRGAADGTQVQGLMTNRNVGTYTGATATDGDYGGQLFNAINSLRGSAYVEPEWVVMHPTDWAKLRLLKDTAGQYMGGGPFLGAYGGPQGPIGASGQITGATENVWGKPVYVTAAIGNAGTALIGTRANAQVWRRGGISIEASNSHASYFALNLVAIRAEERVGLAVYRPKGYCILKFQ